jgi:hypothetical protein
MVTKQRAKKSAPKAKDDEAPEEVEEQEPDEEPDEDDEQDEEEEDDGSDEDDGRGSKDNKALLRRAYGSASQKLRESHRDEFNELYAAEAAELGVEWSPRKTPEQRAEEQFQQLLQEYPSLREKIE